MLVNMKGVLANAAKGGYAIGGFNFASLESGLGAVRASGFRGVCPQRLDESTTPPMPADHVLTFPNDKAQTNRFRRQ